MAEQFGLFPPSGPVDKATADILALIDGDPVHARDRAIVVDAIVATARENGGVIDPNKVRQKIGGRVYSRVVGSTYHALADRGVIKADGWVISTDKAGRNSGRPARRYRLRSVPSSVGDAA